MCDLPGFKKWDGYNLVFRPVGSNIAYIQRVWPAAEWTDGTERFIEEYRNQVQAAEATLRLKHGPLPETRGGYVYKRPPREHQRRALLLSWNKKYFALLMEQRTGKTKVVIDNSAYLFQLSHIHTLIIISINGVHRNWVDNEIPLDMPDSTPYESFFTRDSFTRRQEYQYDKTLRADGKLSVFAFHIEAFSTASAVRALFERALGDGCGVMLAIDEATRIKNYSAARTEYMIKEGHRAEYRRILTGTQAPEGRPDELFAQYKFLNESILGYDTITSYRSHFCCMPEIQIADGSGGKKDRRIIVPGCRNADELKALIDPYSYRVRRNDCMDLPPKVYKRHPVSMTREQKRIYNELNSEYITEFRGKTLTAALAITRALRLQQILCGWWPMEEEDLIDGETWKNIREINTGDNPRMKAIDDILEDNEDRKIIIWARFRPDLQVLSNKLGKRAVSYHGGIKSDKRAANYKAFREDPDIQFFLANQSCAGYGLTLPMATLHAFHSNDFSLQNRTQAEDRSEGDESRRESTLIIDLETPGTIDTKIIRQFKQKKNFADLINGDPKSIFLEEDND